MTVPGPVKFQHRAFAALAPRELHDLLRLRAEVFVVEQRIWQENDLDGRDPDALHAWGRLLDGEVVATGRVITAVRPAVVSRIVVRRDARGRGVGTGLMQYLHERVLGTRPAVLSAQAHLEPWYRRLGWSPQGEPYDEVGIPHVRMVRTPEAEAT